MGCENTRRPAVNTSRGNEHRRIGMTTLGSPDRIAGRMRHRIPRRGEAAGGELAVRVKEMIRLPEEGDDFLAISSLRRYTHVSIRSRFSARLVERDFRHDRRWKRRQATVFRWMSLRKLCSNTAMETPPTCFNNFGPLGRAIAGSRGPNRLWCYSIVYGCLAYNQDWKETVNNALIFSNTDDRIGSDQRLMLL